MCLPYCHCHTVLYATPRFFVTKPCYKFAVIQAQKLALDTESSSLQEKITLFAEEQEAIRRKQADDQAALRERQAKEQESLRENQARLQAKERRLEGLSKAQGIWSAATQVGTALS